MTTKTTPSHPNELTKLPAKSSAALRNDSGCHEQSKRNSCAGRLFISERLVDFSVPLGDG